MRNLVHICLRCVFILSFCCVSLTGSAAEKSSEGDLPVRFAMHASFFMGINESDGKAAFKVWAQHLGEIEDVLLDPNILIVKDWEQCLELLKQNPNLMVSIPIRDYSLMSPDLFGDFVYLTINNSKLDTAYVLLVNRGSGFNDLSDLAGMSLNVYDNISMDLALDWLNCELSQSGLSEADKYFGKIKSVEELTSAVLPVFFGQADACLVSEEGLALLSELNPQLGIELTVLELSPPVIPSMMLTSASFQPEVLSVIRKSIPRLSQLPSGQQLISLFHAEDITFESIEVLDPTLELLERWKAVEGNSTGTTNP